LDELKEKDKAAQVCEGMSQCSCEKKNIKTSSIPDIYTNVFAPGKLHIVNIIAVLLLRTSSY